MGWPACPKLTSWFTMWEIILQYKGLEPCRLFYCCEKGKTCWQTREGAPGGFFCPIQFLILSHILCFRKQYHVLTLSHWNGNTGLSSLCIAWAPKGSDRHCLCYPPLCYVLFLVSKWWIGSLKGQVSRSLNISALLVLLLEHPLAMNHNLMLKKSQPERKATGKCFLLIFLFPSLR